MVKKILIISFLLVAAPPLAGQGLLLSPDTVFADVPLSQQADPCPPECVTDSMEIVTWYPSPYNEYEELRLYPTQRDANYCDNDKIGLMYYDHGGTPSFPDNDKMMICKGTLLGWQEVSSEGFWKFADSSTSDIYYTKSGNVGIGTDTPKAKLHVAGDIKIGNSSAVCNADTEGSIRYNAAHKRMEFCNGSSWDSLSSVYIPPVTCGAWSVFGYSITTPNVSNATFSSAASCKSWCESSPTPTNTKTCLWQQVGGSSTYNCYSGYDTSSVFWEGGSGYSVLQAATCSSN